MPEKDIKNMPGIPKEPSDRQTTWESDDKYGVLFASIDAGFCVIEVLFDDGGKPIDYVFIEANPGFEHQTGLVNPVGKRMRDLAPDHEDYWFRIYGEVARTGIANRFEAAAEALHRWFGVSAFAVGEPGRNLVAILFVDISERKQVELALREADRRKDEFIAILSHELRNPLAPLRNGLQLMALERDNAEVVERTRQMMQRQVDHMVSLVDDLLDVSRINSGLIQLRLQKVDVIELLHEVMETADAELHKHGHQISLTLPASPVIIDADPVRLSQVLTNLLHNAAKYTPSGGNIALTVSEHEGDVRISIADDGIGIPEDKFDTIFELFSQVQSDSVYTEGGLGIGLALAKQIVLLHGGSIFAQSNGLDAGSCFTVCLPISAVAESSAANDHSEKAAVERQRRILVADDNVDAADSLSQILQLLGHDVHTVYDGEAALDIAPTFNPDVVLLDIGMPRLDGLETARRLRQLPGGGDLLLVAVTGWGQNSDRNATKAAGFNEHLVKPFDLKDLQFILQA